MPYNLFVTQPGGTPRKSLRSPYNDRHDTTATVRMIIEMAAGSDEGRPLTFAERVAAYPLGEDITHSGLGITFRTERI